jgi:serine/threonine protein kinase
MLDLEESPPESPQESSKRPTITYITGPTLKYRTSKNADNTFTPTLYTFADGTTFDPLQITTFDEKMGEGSSGDVYKITRGGRAYILKRIVRNFKPELVNREIKALKAVATSPYVVQLLAAVVYNDRAFLLYPFVAGCTYSNWIRAAPKPDEIERITNQLIAGLASMHAKGWAHNDIKADNVWIPSDPKVYATYLDLGSATQISSVKETEADWATLAAMLEKPLAGGAKGERRRCTRRIHQNVRSLAVSSQRETKGRRRRSVRLLR